jgi:4-methyl-5(b-hydroxyethyl)-thiazole monophosphate biosynthesis
MAKKVILLLADGFEEVEAVTPVDYLRRAAIEVTTVSISESLTVTGRWTGIKMLADTTLSEFKKTYTDAEKNYDAVILPGGIPGAENLAASKDAGALIKKMAAAGKLICAICASPVYVLAPLGLIAGKKFTCYPGIENNLQLKHDGIWSADNVVIDGNIITSRAAGTAGLFSAAIIEKLLDKEAAKKTADTVLL